MPPSTLMTMTREAALSIGIASATVRAVSVDPFQATTMFSPSEDDVFAAASSTGRPVSNNAASQVSCHRPAGSPPVRPTTTRSNRRPYSATT